MIKADMKQFVLCWLFNLEEKMFQERTNLLQKKLKEMHFDCFLVTEPTNRFYLSGFSGDDGVLLITAKNQYLITDWRFERQIQQECPNWKLCLTRNYLQEVCQLAQKLNLTALAFEDSLSYANYGFLDENFPGDLAAVTQIIEQLRSVKEPAEIQVLKRSCQIAGKGYLAVLDLMKNNSAALTELALSHYLDGFMLKQGASGKSFTTIVASGEHSTWPHATATNQLIGQNTMVTLDFGYFYHGYTSDVTRTFAIGPQTTEFRELYQLVLKAQQATIQAIVPGVMGSKLDKIGRGIITQAGYGKYFNHGMGHGIGLAIHELPNVGQRFTDQLFPGQIITIEPGVYVPGIGGVRIEDDILVTETGYEVLTDFDRQYHEL
ncbi:Xaa-Pro dipeptidase [Liquorilactobacillus vini DSM 20605]|uniref:Xaa-Pro dipeptidase n=2 Tax=Liquorilactobacillus vini TaxID=238015 RepID=A0A0R2C4U1_9LACO|nr:Xaa-Pro dipeptidase [Liquorilactobacillus vini DSM 20605]